MSTKKDKGKLEGKQSAREKMRFDSSATAEYVDKNRQEQLTKRQHRLRAKPLNVALGNVYPNN